MFHRKPEVSLLSIVAGIVAALAVASCASDDEKGSARAPAKPASSGGAASVEVRDSGLGRILTDSSGRTLYLFEKDTGSKSTCTGKCASVWPPLTTAGEPKAGPGATASKLGTTKRSDGKREVSYGGHPLYLYAADTKPGETKGQELEQFGAEWYAVSPSGEKAEKQEGPKKEGSSGY